MSHVLAESKKKSSLLSKAFVQAYKQMVANASRQASGNESGSGGGSKKSKSAARRGEISTEEAADIMNVRPDSTTLEELERRFKVMFDNNDPKKGGSFYLQSKIFNAHERLKAEVAKSQATEATEEKQ
ncbi:TIM23 translocase complex subunit Tim16 [Schizosaccharomyces japonicus yFS275]|uniref:Mitochondrial import inner membrane translocase subunit TIM16 n=1 Tax=Schizosaccharomyces japonicus (strain yFS275 / FY16936) TaxID=402676 RepID=B6JVG2_SCHJY|nr:TIM23 translocase complex subunit Tim16 [Schizosaccharomyces japonicus yFS275]EEB05363.1 TIM23 translocase complex subunit Tim16 [Schizosaccharomyces japonicus yFS275]